MLRIHRTNVATLPCVRTCYQVDTVSECCKKPNSELKRSCAEPEEIFSQIVTCSSVTLKFIQPLRTGFLFFLRVEE